MTIVIDLGEEQCRLSPRLSAAILAAARRRKKSPAHIIGLALRQSRRQTEQRRAQALARRLGCSPGDAVGRAVSFLLTYLQIGGKPA